MSTRLALGNRQNDAMRVLTVMASIFMPLTLLAGVYGMNSESTPESCSTWMYPMLLAIMVVVGAGMTVDFKRKGWLGGK